MNADPPARAAMTVATPAVMPHVVTAKALRPVAPVQNVSIVAIAQNALTVLAALMPCVTASLVVARRVALAVQTALTNRVKSAAVIAVTASVVTAKALRPADLALSVSSAATVLSAMSAPAVLT